MAEKRTYRLIRSSRKTVAIQITPGGELVVRAPNRMPLGEIDAFVQSKERWIRKHLRPKGDVIPVTQRELQLLAEQAKKDLPERVRRFAPLLGVFWGRITIRAQHSRWGSCSGAGNLNFNCLLMLTPPEVRDYVVVHELCHRLEMNHSPAFWAQVERILPDYRSRKQWLRENGNALIAQLPE